MVLASLNEQLAKGRALSAEQVAMATAALVAEDVAAESKAEFLTLLAAKGETIGEIAAFARELRQLSLQPPLDAITRAAEILDVCGTGGDRLNTFNISTCVAIVAASAGVFVAKHGNRAITSQAGSADVLEALGVRTDLSAEEAATALREHHFAFFFAPNFHPAFKHIGPARKLCAARGQRTIFNILGPLLNPARPTAQLIGVPRPELCEPIARVLQDLGARRGMVVCGAVTRATADLSAANNGAAYLDEISTFGETRIAEFYQDRAFNVSRFSPADFPIQPGSIADLVGSDRETNAAIVRNLLQGAERGPKRDAVLLNSAAALVVAGRTSSMAAGWEFAAELIDTGRALAKLESLVVRPR